VRGKSIALWCCAVLFAASACGAAWFLVVPDHAFALMFAAPAALFPLVLVPVCLGLATLALALSRRYPLPSRAERRSEHSGAP
jgi:hypothetical protein